MMARDGNWWAGGLQIPAISVEPLRTVLGRERKHFQTQYNSYRSGIGQWAF